MNPRSSRLPMKAYFQSSVRTEGGDAGRSGSGRRGGSRWRNPRHVRNWAYERSSRVAARRSRTAVAGRRAASASVVRSRHTSQPSAREITAMSWPGVARSSTSARTSAQCAVPVLPTSASRSSARASGRVPSERAAALMARAWSPASTTCSRSSTARPLDLSAAVMACSTSGTSTCSPKRSSHCSE